MELFTSKSRHWCIEIQPNFPLEAISVMFSVAHVSKEEKYLLLNVYIGNFAGSQFRNSENKPNKLNQTRKVLDIHESLLF